MERGADMVKVFPAHLWSPSTLKSVRGVGMFGDVKLVPSGVYVCVCVCARAMLHYCV